MRFKYVYHQEYHDALSLHDCACPFAYINREGNDSAVVLRTLLHLRSVFFFAWIRLIFSSSMFTACVSRYIAIHIRHMHGRAFVSRINVAFVHTFTRHWSVCMAACGNIRPASTHSSKASTCILKYMFIEVLWHTSILFVCFSYVFVPYVFISY